MEGRGQRREGKAGWKQEQEWVAGEKEDVEKGKGKESREKLQAEEVEV